MTDDADEGAALEAEDLRELAEVFAEVSIAPLGRNYFGRYREIRNALQEWAGEVEDAVGPDEIRERLEEDDFEFMDAIVRNLRNFAEDGIDREGEVEPYRSALADADRLEPHLDLLRPHLEGG